MGTVYKVDMLATLQILKGAGLPKPSKAVGIDGSDVKDMKGFGNLSMAQRGILRYGVAAVQASIARTTTTATAVATPQGPRSSKVQDAIANLAGRDASEAMVASAVSLSESKNFKIAELLDKAGLRGMPYALVADKTVWLLVRGTVLKAKEEGMTPFACV